MWEVFIGKRCKVKTVVYEAGANYCVYEGIVCAVDDEVIQIDLKKVSSNLVFKSSKVEGLTLIRKNYIVSITIVE